MFRFQCGDQWVPSLYRSPKRLQIRWGFTKSRFEHGGGECLLFCLASVSNFSRKQVCSVAFSAEGCSCWTVKQLTRVDIGFGQWDNSQKGRSHFVKCATEESENRRPRCPLQIKQAGSCFKVRIALRAPTHLPASHHQTHPPNRTVWSEFVPFQTSCSHEACSVRLVQLLTKQENS